MRAASQLTRRAWPLALLAGLVACAPAPEPLDEPSSRALEIFTLARDGDPSDTRVAELFDAESNEMWRVRLYDALTELARVDEPTIERTEPLEGLDRMVIDLTGRLPSEGEARFSVQVERRDEDVWKIVSFFGPGVSWPPRRTGKGSGLSTWPEN
jgi:hypothetical protein